MSNKRILLVSQEIAPYAPASPLATMSREIAQGVHSRASEVRVFMPKYGTVNERRNQLHEVIRLSGVNIPIDDNDHPLIIKVASLQPSRIQAYFIDNDDYFQKEDSDIDAAGSNRPDNDERTLFFARGMAETVRKLRWDPGVVHCMGWMTALAPLYMRRVFGKDPAFKESKVVYTVTDDSLAAPLDPRMFDKLRADGLSAKALEPYKTAGPDVNTLHAMAIDNADAVIFDTDTPDAALLERARARGIRVLTRADLAGGVETYKTFYSSLAE